MITPNYFVLKLVPLYLKKYFFIISSPQIDMNIYYEHILRNLLKVFEFLVNAAYFFSRSSLISCLICDLSLWKEIYKKITGNSR